jgi:hypothetical protein
LIRLSKMQVAAALMVLALGTAGCARRGALEPPPTPESIAQQKAEDADPTRPHPRHKPKPIERPNRPFFLDPLL